VKGAIDSCSLANAEDSEVTVTDGPTDIGDGYTYYYVSTDALWSSTHVYEVTLWLDLPATEGWTSPFILNLISLPEDSHITYASNDNLEVLYTLPEAGQGLSITDLTTATN